MNQFSIISMFQPTQKTNHTTHRISRHLPIALAGFFALTLSACHGPCRMNPCSCEMTPNVVYERPVKMDSCECYSTGGSYRVQSGYSALGPRPVTMKPGTYGTSCRFSQAGGCAPAAAPNLTPAQMDFTPAPVVPQTPGRRNGQISPAPATNDRPYDLSGDWQAPPRVKPKAEVKPEAEPEVKAEVKPQKKSEIKPGLELEQMPFEGNSGNGQLMQERSDVPGNTKVMEVPRNNIEEAPAPEELLPAEPEAPAEAIESLDPLGPAEPAAPAEPIELDLPDDSVQPGNQELPGLEEELPDVLPEALPETKASEDPQQIMKAIQKRQPLKRALGFDSPRSEHKSGFWAQSSKNSMEKQTASAPEKEKGLKSISFSDIRQATSVEECLNKDVQSANWEVVEKKEAVIKLTAAEEPVAANPAPQPLLEIPAELPEEATIGNFPERPSNAQPADEYIIDSTKSARKKDVSEIQKGMVSGVEVKGNWEADHQNETGTFIYYDGMQGRTTIQSPDPVYIYAPRFRAVRQVIDLNVDEQVTTTGDLYTPTQVSTANRSLETSTTRQNQQAGTGTSRTVMLEAQANAGTGILDGNIAPQMKTQEAVIPQENREINGPNAINGKTRAITADGLIEFKTWTQTENMRVFIDQQSASASIQTLSAPSLYTVQEGEKKQDVKIYKVASTNSAKPGETVDFIIYFENTGNSPIGNITLVDNLPARLEIVEDSAESSVDSNFTYEINGNGSQTLRWEVTQPLYVGEKGAVKFKALVR